MGVVLEAASTAWVLVMVMDWTWHVRERTDGTKENCRIARGVDGQKIIRSCLEHVTFESLFRYLRANVKEAAR